MTLKHANKDYEEKLKAGDLVVYQKHRMEDVDHGLKTIPIELMEVEEVDKYTMAFKPKGANYYLPVYRIRQVIVEDLSYRFKGYDYNYILLNEGQISEETFVELRKLKRRGSDETVA